jgi:hypothetical protein
MPPGGATISGALRGSLVWLAAIGFWLKLLSVWLLAARLLRQESRPGRASVSTFINEGCASLQWHSRPASEDDRCFITLTPRQRSYPLPESARPELKQENARSAPEES